jgi:flavorubredoxin
VRPDPVRPDRIARDAWLVSELFPGPHGAHVPVRSLVITGAEPVIVDTGTSYNRHAWTDAVWSIVDPRDVRWVFLSHDDHDHVGNALEVLASCPQATLVTSWFATERLAGDLPLPLHRMRWLDDGGTLEVGDRQLHVVRPPVFDAPTTRGLFDPVTGVYWAADAFASLVTPDVVEAEDLDDELWERSFLDMNRAISPWHELLDAAKYGRLLQRLAAMPTTAIIGAHGAVLRGERVARAYDLLRRLPVLPAVELPGQDVLDALLAPPAAAPAA